MNAYIVFTQNGSRHVYDHSTTSATSSVQLGGKANLFDYLFFSQRKEVWFNGIRNKSNFYIINIGVRTVNYNIHHAHYYWCKMKVKVILIDLF